MRVLVLAGTAEARALCAGLAAAGHEVLASLAGVLYICDQSVADPQTLGRGYELNAIAAAVVGGCSLAGGVGTIPGTVLGALFLRVVIDGVAKIIKTGADVYEGLIVGGVVILAVAFTQTASGGGSVRRFFAGPLGWAMLGVIAVGGAVAAAVWLPTRSSPAHGWYAVAAGLALAGVLAGLDRLRGGLSNMSRR